METGGDSKAAREERQFAEGKSVEEMGLEARRNEHGRTERFKDHFEKLAQTGLTIAFWAAVAFAAVWCWHVIMPSCLRWLKPEELDHLQNLIAGAALDHPVSRQWKGYWQRRA